VSRDQQHRHGLAFQYSLPYLSAFVKDVGLPTALRRAVPLGELTLAKPLDHSGGATIRTINPGVLFAGRTMQFGIEVVIPINRHTGGSTGVLLQLHFFLDDLLPRSLGRPLFGGAPCGGTCVAVAGLALAGAAFAHAMLDRASPAVGSRVAASPARIELWFTEALEPAFSAVNVLDAGGRQVDQRDTAFARMRPAMSSFPYRRSHRGAIASSDVRYRSTRT
jgi:hypothetical protein